jgi:hypothetical protein
MDVCLQWAVSGCVVQTWSGVPAQTTLGELVTDELDNLPGEMRIIHKSKEVMLHDALQTLTASLDTVLIFNLVRIHAYKRNIIEIVPYICLDGFTAVRMRDLGIVVTFPKREPERFSHVVAAMRNEFVGEDQTNFQMQVLALIKQDLPGAVLRRKVRQFVEDGEDNTVPRMIRCFLLFDADGELSLKMNWRGFHVVDAPSSEVIWASETMVSLIFADRTP